MTLSTISRSLDTNAQKKMQTQIIQYLKAHGVTDVEPVNVSGTYKSSGNKHGLVVRG